MLSSFKHYKTLLPPDMAQYDAISESGSDRTTFQFISSPVENEAEYHFIFCLNNI
ncbi:hypothetical protein [Chloroflexus sp.]|uniref:hypothetical protein n=1 Tax=Chloroflexus sp. TaxID=1904827 RepID=UPI002ADDB486|nr:hypothetical protein [Chloroflexus sp.]